MASLELCKRSGYQKVLFGDDEIILYKKDSEITIPTDYIERIEYAKKSFINYILNLPGFFGGPCPGRLEIYLTQKIGKTKLYLVKIKNDEVWKLPKYYRIKIGISNYYDP